MVDSVEIMQIPSDLNRVEEVDALINKLFGDLDEELFNKIQLAVNEAVVNAIVHGNQGEITKKVWVTIREQASNIEIKVKDEGSGFNPDSIADPTDEDNLLKIGGRGIFLIKHLADEVTFEENGTLVNMLFRA